MTDGKPLVLKLGVLDVPYQEEGVTTGDVAGFLESKYGVVEFFWDTHEEELGQVILDSLEGSMESMLMGAPDTADPFASGLATIESKFRDMLTSKDFDGKIAGVPTEAAKSGYSKRFKKPGKKRGPRPSFIDTGLYEGSFRAWVNDDE